MEIEFELVLFQASITAFVTCSIKTMKETLIYSLCQESSLHALFVLQAPKAVVKA